MEKNPHEEELMENLEHFLNNRGDKDHKVPKDIE